MFIDPCNIPANDGNNKKARCKHTGLNKPKPTAMETLFVFFYVLLNQKSSIGFNRLANRNLFWRVFNFLFLGKEHPQYAIVIAGGYTFCIYLFVQGK